MVAAAELYSHTSERRPDARARRCEDATSAVAWPCGTAVFCRGARRAAYDAKGLVPHSAPLTSKGDARIKTMEL